jgi:hypothetical protein
MNRTTFRNIMILVSLVLAGLALLFYFQGKKAQANVQTDTYTLQALRQELDNVARLSAALTELDQMTIDEKTATQLNLLRHLNIEQNDFYFQVMSRQVLTLGESSVISRQVELQTKLPYPETLKLMDDLYNTKKLQVVSIEMEPVYPLNGNVALKLTGNVYGLEKNTSGTEVIQ